MRLEISGFAWATAIVVSSLVIFPVCFVLFYEEHSAEIIYIGGYPQLPTLSLTGGYRPGMELFTDLLHFFAVCAFFLLSMVSEAYEVKLKQRTWSESDNEQDSLVIANSILYWLTIIFSVTLWFTGSIPVTIYPTMHAIFAIVSFLSGCFHIIIFKFTLGLPDTFQDTPAQNYWHLCAFLLTVPVNVTALITSWLVGMTCTEPACFEFALQMVIVVEYVTALALLLYVAGFYQIPEVMEACIVIRLAPLPAIINDDVGEVELHPRIGGRGEEEEG
jgi:hypothetical protein